MSESTNLNIRIDKELKERAEAFFNELGLNMSSAFNIFVRQALRQGKIPFELSVVPESINHAISNVNQAISQNGVNMDELGKYIQEAIEGSFLAKVLEEVRVKGEGQATEE